MSNALIRLAQRISRDVVLTHRLAALRQDYRQTFEQQAKTFVGPTGTQGDKPLGPRVLPDGFRLDCEPDRGDLLSLAASASMACSCVGLGVLLLPLTLTTWYLARNDLARMGKGVTDPSGEFLARSSRNVCNVALVITAAHTLFLLLYILGR